MNRLLYLLILLLSVQAQAAITITSRGSANAAAGSTTLAVTPASTLAVNHIGLVIYAVDNSGTSGSTKVFTSSTFNDSVGNTWTRQVDAIYNPAGVNSGVEIACYTSTLATQLTTSDNVTVTFGVSTSGRTVRLLDIAGATGPYFITASPLSDLLTSGQTGTAVSMTTGSIPSGDAVVCWAGSEQATGSDTGDSDTTNGSWAAITSVSATTSPMRQSNQSKIVTGTGTQTWDITLGASADWNSAWIQFSETSPTPPSNSTSNGFLIWN